MPAAAALEPGRPRDGGAGGGRPDSGGLHRMVHSARLIREATPAQLPGVLLHEAAVTLEASEAVLLLRAIDGHGHVIAGRWGHRGGPNNGHPVRALTIPGPNGTVGAISVRCADTPRSGTNGDDPWDRVRLLLEVAGPRLAGHPIHVGRVRSRRTDTPTPPPPTHPGVGIATLDGRNRFVRVNDAVAALTGRPVEEHLGHTPSEVLPAPVGTVVEQRLAEVRRRGEPLGDIEIQGLGSDGRPVTWGIELFPLVDGGGGAGVGMVVVDLRDRVRPGRLGRHLRSRSLDRRNSVLDDLQRQLLPVPDIHLPWVEVAARYLSAEVGSRVGGDWYDVFIDARGRLVATIGDAVGHGMDSVGLMTLLMRSLRAHLLLGGDPAVALSRVHRVAAQIAGGMAATAAVVCIDPAHGTVMYSSAGHPWPAVAAADGVTFLDDAQGPPLGALVHPGFRTAVRHLRSGDVLALYTDGVVERRHQGIDTGISLLAEEFGAAAAGSDGSGRAETVADRVMAALTNDVPLEDDACLLVVELLDLPEPPNSTP